LNIGGSANERVPHKFNPPNEFFLIS